MQPSAEVVPIQRRRVEKEVIYATEHLEKLRLGLGIDRWQSICMIFLKKEGRYVTSCDLKVVKRQYRILNGTSNHGIRIAEEVFIVTISAAERDDSGN